MTRHSIFRSTSRLLAVLGIMGGSLLLGSCTAPPPPEASAPSPSPAPPPDYQRPARHLGLQDFGDPNADRLRQRLRAGKQADTVLRIVQLGDSHTASDTFTKGLRARLRTDLGDAGIGWITPMNVRGMGHSLIKIQSKNWRLTSSRTDESDHFPLGGYIAQAARKNAWIRVDAHQPDDQPYRATLLLRQTADARPLLLQSGAQRHALSARQAAAPRIGGWRYLSTRVQLPFTLTAADAGKTELGGIWLEKETRHGVLISPIGTNGARQGIWGKWQADWPAQLAATRADLVIIAYGTNESFDPDLDPAALRATLEEGIRVVRAALPRAAVLLIAAPDALRAATNEHLPCAQRRPLHHKTVKQAQLTVAKSQHTLYWDWESAQGGACPMLDWQARGLVGKDLVHFTRDGYQESARRLYLDLKRWERQGNEALGAVAGEDGSVTETSH
ncbi:GDSL-type esterase/lipase family protein [Castellaniella hirudinis]|uniref:GDSL-type esterase/lipase family protein n=1 Tax=Castellaniella hirudinis TaxID=1144617 RepID=UPI0039C29B78